MDEHLATCPACRARHADFFALCDALHALRDFEPVMRFEFRRAIWPLAIAASVLIALWPSSPEPQPIEPQPPTWFAYQRAAARSDEALDALLREHANVFDERLSATNETLLTSVRLQP
ncbi:MAG: hypothetical protein ABMA13_11220 [Chthoniobacteraceae bacterium]